MKLNLPVEEFTTPNPVTASEQSGVEQMLALMAEHGVRHLPVAGNDGIVGVVSERDLRVIQGLGEEHKRQVTAQDIMSTDPVSVTSKTPLDQAAYLMSERKIGSVLVREENGEFLGIFTLTDALNALIEIVRPHADW